MVRQFEGDHHAEGLRFAIVASRFNDEIVAGLLAGATNCLLQHGASDDSLEIFRVPGAFEVPGMAAKLIRLNRYDAVVAIGALIRGDTPHFDHIASQVTMEISRVSVDSGVPVAFGVITCNTVDQARARSGPASGNKGWEAALAAIEMANLHKVIG
ncbi:MAG: 6,7-dimethyl-8-ribityllumazine synthase [Acidobacteriota bacterium]